MKPLERILKKIGGWPAVEGDNWNDQDFDWKELIYNLREEGLFMSFLFDFKITYEINGTHLVVNLFIFLYTLFYSRSRDN